MSTPNDPDVIYYLPPTLDRVERQYVMGFMFRGGGAWRMQKSLLTLPDFMAWVHATMPRPYPVKEPAQMVRVDKLEYSNGVTVYCNPVEPVDTPTIIMHPIPAATSEPVEV